MTRGAALIVVEVAVDGSMSAYIAAMREELSRSALQVQRRLAEPTEGDIQAVELGVEHCVLAQIALCGGLTCGISVGAGKAAEFLECDGIVFWEVGGTLHSFSHVGVDEVVED